MIAYTALVAEARTLLAYAGQFVIPYQSGGMALTGMDCQGLCEYLLMRCGLSKAEANLAGSNAHWRKSLKWRGTVEQCVALFGEIPKGAWLFIHTEGRNGKYGDEDGDASHMGQYMDGLQAVHASASKGKVAESAVKQKSINGGWNRVGLNRWTTFAPEVERILTEPAVGELHGSNEGGAPSVDAPAVGEPAVGELHGSNEKGETPEAPEAPKKQYVRVETANGAGVKIREKPEKGAVTKFPPVPEGTVLQVLGAKGHYYRVHYQGKARYVEQRFVTACDVRGNAG